MEGDSGVTHAVFKVIRSGSTPLPITVEYQTVDGSAKENTDYKARSGIVEFVGTQSEDVVVPVFGDRDAESSEVFYLDLSNAVNATIVDGRGRATIENDDLPVLLINDVDVLESNDGSRDVEFTVSLQGVVSEPVSVGYATADGTATVAGRDYRSVSGELDFQLGRGVTQTEKIAVPVMGDESAELNELFFVNLSDPVNAVIVDGRGLGTILNDDQPRLVIHDVEVYESDPKGAVFSVTLEGQFSEDVSVIYQTTDGTASAAEDDYNQVAPTPLIFEPSGLLLQEQKITILVKDDEIAENDENFFVDLSSPVNAVIEGPRAVGTILDKDPEAKLSITDVKVLEGDSGVGKAALTVSLDRRTGEEVRVIFATADGTATVADSDYPGPIAGLLTFYPGGELAQELVLPFNGDTRVEADETILINLSVASDNAMCEKCQGVVTILDDDKPSQLKIASAPSTLEGASVAVVTVERTEPGSEAASVKVTAGSGSAIAGEDFTAVSEVLEWGPRQAGVMKLEVPILDDNLREEDESIIVRLSDVSGSDLGMPSELELIILDDDTPMDLEPDGDPERQATSGEQLELKVFAGRGDGQPLQGVAVTWKIEGDAELLDGETTLTNTEGIASQRVRLGNRPGEVRVTAEIQGIEDTVSFEIEVAGVLAGITNPNVNPGEAAVAEVLEKSCTTATGDFGDLCDFVFDLEDSADQAQALEEMTPEEASAPGTVSRDSPRVQIGNVSSRLAALRGGAASRIGLGQLAFSFSGGSLGIGQLRAGLASYSAEKEWLKGALDRAVLAYKQGRDVGPVAGPESAAESPFGFFMSGRISFGDRPESEREEGFDFETLGLTAGVDYSFSERLIGGIALGYLDTQTEIVADGGELEAQGYSLSTFGTYYVRDFFIEGVLSYGHTTYDQVRNIDLPQPFRGQSRFTARSEANGHQLSASLGGGYEASFGAISIAGTGNLTWVSSAIDGFSERGAGPLNLKIEDQTVESLQSLAKLDLTRAISFPSWRVALHPVVSLAYLHEFENDSRLIRGSFVEDSTGNTFEIPTESPDRDFLRLSVGLTMAWIRGRTAFLVYDQDFARTDLNLYTISLGMRLGL